MIPQQSERSPETAGRIVVGVDGSAPSRAALRWAVEEAARTGRAVHAVMVWNPDPLFATPPTEYLSHEEISGDHLGKLAQCVSAARNGHAQVKVTYALCEGSTDKQLVAQAEGAAMLVLGSHGRGRAGTAFLGSVGTACVRHASCPVLIIPPHMATEAPTAKQVVSGWPQQIAGPWF